MLDLTIISKYYVEYEYVKVNFKVAFRGRFDIDVFVVCLYEE